MFRLSVLGRIDLRDAEGSEVRPLLAQPKRMALLVYLATSMPQRFHRRDALLPLFWPELAEESARNALRQALHQLRGSLGPGVVVSRGADALGIDPALLSCDAVEFEEALDCGQLADALRLYVGTLLPGFAIAGAPEFDSWLDGERARLRRRAARAAWAHAEQRERAGAVDEAAASARRAAELNDDEPALRQLVELLERVGDSAGAVRAFEEYASRLRRELDVEPSPELRELVDAIRARSRDVAPGQAAAADGASRSRNGRNASTNGARMSVVVSSFENLTGNPAHDFVGRLAATTIAQGLAETRLVDVVVSGGAAGSPVDHAVLVIEGSYLLVDDGWNLRAAMRGRDGRGVGAIAAVTARRERPWEGAQELSRRVSGAVAGHLDPRVASWADVVSEPPSLEAHQSHRHGMELHLRGEFRPAIAHFLRAAKPDEGFAVPMIWAIQASCNLEEYEQAAAIHEELAAARSRLSPAEQLGCDYHGAWLAGDRGGALRILRQVAALVPDTEVLSQLGRDALFLNHPRFAVETLERVDPERGWMPSWAPYWRRLTEAYHMLGDHQRELGAARRGRSQHPESVGTLLSETRALAALGDVDAVRRSVDEGLALGDDPFTTAGELMFVAAQELRTHGHAVDGRQLLERAIAWQRERCAAEQASFSDRLLLVRMHHEGGQWRDAAAMLHELEREHAGEDAVLGAAGTLAAHSGNVPAASAALAALRARTGRFHFGRHLMWGARIAAVLGERDDALSMMRGAFARGYPYGVELHTDFDLMTLARDERFRELLRPKG
jgi:DNA-binding SARP family transcriptional activator